MKSGLKKSLYFGLAAVSVLAASSLATTTASAKTYAKVTSNKTMTTAPETRNVTANGTNALYTKAGTLRGARVVASKSTMAALGNSKKSQNYFRAYKLQQRTAVRSTTRSCHLMANTVGGSTAVRPPLHLAVGLLQPIP